MPRNACIICKRDSNEAPLIAIDYRQSAIHICAQHLPVLIHDPAQLIGILPGAEGMSPSAVHD